MNEENRPRFCCMTCVWRGRQRKDGWLNCKAGMGLHWHASICREYEYDA